MSDIAPAGLAPDTYHLYYGDNTGTPSTIGGHGIDATALPRVAEWIAARPGTNAPADGDRS